MTSDTVVPKIVPLAEDDFHAALLQDWSRMIGKWKLPTFALKAGYHGPRQLNNFFKGSIPEAVRIFNLLAADDGAIASVLRAYGLKAVPLESFCSNEPGTLPVTVLLHHVAAAEHPQSHGGTQITEHEARGIPEEDLLAAERVIARIRVLRKPKAVA